MECEHRADYADEHSCYPDGSAVTLNPARWIDHIQRQTVAVIDADGSRTAYVDHPATARGIYAAERSRLADQQR